MNFEDLKIFHTLAKKRNFSETAKSLHMTQPNVSLHIRRLEEHLGVKLFERTTKKVYLTPIGKVLFSSSELILRQIHSTKKEIEMLSNTIQGTLIIGASLTVGEYILPYLFGEFVKVHPNISLKLKLNNSAQIITKLKDTEIHLGFIESMLKYPDFKQEAFLEDELIIITSPHNSLIETDYITIDQLFSLPFIMREQGSGTRQVIEEKLKENNLDPSKLNIVLELESTESIKSAVESITGISIISHSAVRKELALNTLKQLHIKDITMKRNFYMLYDEHYLSLTADIFVKFLKENICSLPNPQISI